MTTSPVFYWTIRQAMAWLQFEDEDECERLRPDNDPFEAVAKGRFREKPQESKQSFEEAEATLLEMLRQGAVNSFTAEGDLPVQFWRCCNDLRGFLKDHKIKVSADQVCGRDLEAPADGAGRNSRLSNSRPTPTESTVKAWLIARVAAWPLDRPPPSQENDWNAARAHFGQGLIRDQFREIRSDACPHEWTTQGKRLLWGELQPSTKSAVISAKRRTPI